MDHEIGVHKGKKIIERTVEGKTSILLEGDDAGIPFTEKKDRVFSPLFPYRSFASVVDLAIEAVDHGYKNSRRRDP